MNHQISFFCHQGDEKKLLGRVECDEDGQIHFHPQPGEEILFSNLASESLPVDGRSGGMEVTQNDGMDFLRALLRQYHSPYCFAEES